MNTERLLLWWLLPLILLSGCQFCVSLRGVSGDCYQQTSLHSNGFTFNFHWQSLWGLVCLPTNLPWSNVSPGPFPSQRGDCCKATASFSLWVWLHWCHIQKTQPQPQQKTWTTLKTPGRRKRNVRTPGRPCPLETSSPGRCNQRRTFCWDHWLTIFVALVNTVLNNYSKL